MGVPRRCCQDKLTRDFGAKQLDHFLQVQERSSGINPTHAGISSEHRTQSSQRVWPMGQARKRYRGGHPPVRVSIEAPSPFPEQAPRRWWETELPAPSPRCMGTARSPSRLRWGRQGRVCSMGSPQKPVVVVVVVVVPGRGRVS